MLGNLRLSGTCRAPTESASGCAGGCRPQPGALGAWCSPCCTESGRPNNRWRSPAVALPFPLTELSLLKPLAVCNPPPPKPSPTTPGTYVQRQGRIGAEARKAPVASPRLTQTAPSWGGSLKARQLQHSLSMGFSRREYWSGLPFPSPGDLPDPGIGPATAALAGRFLTAEPPGKPTP